MTYSLPFTGTEFLANNQTIDYHPYAAAFGQFLGNGIEPDVANALAFGYKRFDLIADPHLREVAMRIYGRFEKMDYWNNLLQSSSNIDVADIPF